MQTSTQPMQTITSEGSQPLITNNKSLNSFLVQYYFNKLDKLSIDKPFWVAYEFTDDSETTRYRYQNYNSFEEFNGLFQKQKSPDLSRFYEIIRGDVPVPESYDIDGKKGTELFDKYKEIGEDALLDIFKYHRDRFIQSHYPSYTCDKETFCILTSSNKDKCSFHIVIRNDFHFKDVYALKIFAKQFNDYLEKETCFQIDTGIYHKNRNMRLLGNTKYGKDRFLKKHRYSSSLDDKQFLFSYSTPGTKEFHIEPKVKEFHTSFIKENNMIDITNNIKTMTQLLPLINSDCDFSRWSTVGTHIKNITDDSPKGFEIFNEWSQKDGCPTYDEGDTYNKWNGFPLNENWNHLGTIRKYAMEEEPEEYVEITKKNDCSSPSAKIVLVDDEEIVFNDTIDIKKEDNYYWVDFERKYMNTVFPSYEDLKENIIQDLPRVLVKITYQKGFFIKKEHKHSICDLIQIKDMKRINFKYLEERIVNKKVFSETNQIGLDALYNECRLPLYSHPEMILDKNIKTTAYNLFKGIQAVKVKEINKDLIDKFFHHLFFIICDENVEASHFLISWIRWIMLYPEIKSKVFVFLFSDEGFGKSSLGNFLSEFVFGETASYICAGLDSLTGKFNKHLMGKLFCQIEELPSTSGDFHKQFDKMKTLITDPRMSCEPKGLDGFTINNHLNFLGCSNNKYSLRMSKTDTRYFVLEIKKKMDKDYWTQYYSDFQNQNFADMLYSYFLKTSDDDYVKFNGRPKIPCTDLKEELINFSLPCHEKFYKDISDGEYQLSKSIIKEEFDYNNKTYKYATSLDELWSQYQDWGHKMGEKDVKRKYLEFTKLKNRKFRFIDLQEKIKNIDTVEFKDSQHHIF